VSTIVADPPRAAAPTQAAAPERPPYRHPAAAIALLGLGGCLLVGVGAGLGPVPGAGALVAVAFGVLVVRRPDIGAWTLVAAAPVLAGLQRGLPVPSLKLSEVLIVFVGGLVLVSADRDHQRPWRAFDWLALAYVAVTLSVGVYDVLLRDLPVGTDTARAVLSPLQYFVLYRAVLVGLPSAAARRRALFLVLAVSVPESLLAIMQQFHVAGVRGLIPSLTGVDIDTTFGPEAGGQRATALFPHWQVLAGYEFMVIVLATSLLVDREQRVMPRWALGAVLVLAGAATLTTVTFTALIAAVACGVLLGAWSHRPGRVVPVLVAGAAIGLVAFGPTLSRRATAEFSNPAGDRAAWVPQTVDYRYRLWTKQYFPVLTGRYVTGYGPDIPPSISFPYTESLYMTLLLRGGILLLAAYLLMAAVLLGTAVAARDDPEPERRATARALAVALVLLLFMHLIEPYFILTGGSHLIWIAAAIALGGQPAAVARGVAGRPLRRESPATAHA
jgi:hypothetical protein